MCTHTQCAGYFLQRLGTLLLIIMISGAQYLFHLPFGIPIILLFLADIARYSFLPNQTLLCKQEKFLIDLKCRLIKEFLGIPDDSGDDIHNTQPGWDHRVKDYLKNNKKFTYEYDFGDGWIHSIEYEGSYDKIPDQKYPVCLDGERAGPPEDVGGVPGYYRFLETIQNPADEDHESMLTWVGGSYDLSVFDARKVKFDNPAKRLKNIF